ncbi:MAG: pyridoxamine 5'-phosphate oxidase family protein [Bacillota bacterium]|nr:pyridoxamine 5'-phosphate oxidase family protein [Bacillota bacterium]
MKDVINYLKTNQYGFLATVENNKPKVRPFGFMYEEYGRLYFCTSSKKDVYRQMKESPVVEYATTSSDMVTVRISGTAVFTEDIQVKEKVLASSELVKSIYKTADNPVFKTFYLEHGDVIVADFSGNPPRNFSF